eukprot:CAMPEP_0115854916 /NCGR_PEP_ID=MMETSP0287-20121206/14275_1 /TAXON_ID=412157 /ORGANISM="Chrysochromulina rotalis, Strain UIO044" /LENGTH=31 /DNA_ID= /DNA_START= /DNA_END= /DNA_ORIENTATION=
MSSARALGWTNQRRRRGVQHAAQAGAQGQAV